MKSSILIALASTGAAVAQSVDVRLMSYNIRWATGSPGTNERPWSVRRPLLADQLRAETTGRDNSMLCFQEAIYSQVQDLQTDLGREWAYYGIGRDDGVREGEFSPIFYRPASWSLQSSRTYWLSSTPDVVGSVGWDAALPRIATLAQFQHVQTGAPFVFMCTHFDHQGQTARENSAQLLVDIAEEWGVLGRAFLGGDLNVEPGNAAYETLAGGLSDVRDVVPAELQSGPAMTYTAFTTAEGDDSQIDHLFVQNATGLTWDGFTTLSNYESGVFISDHRAVVVDFELAV